MLLDLFERGEPLDKIAVAEELRRRGLLERVGGLPYIGALMETVQTAASARYYATIVQEKSVLRSLIHAGTQITQLGFEGEEDVPGALDQSEQLVYTIGERRGITRVHAGQPLDEGRLRPYRSPLPPARRPDGPDGGLP